MKRTLLFAILTVFAGAVFSQITITQSQMPSGGDTPRYSTVNPVGVSLGLDKKGASQTWDYSGLVSNGQDIYQYKSANSTPYAFYFLNQVGLKTADSLGFSTFTFKNIYSFYTKNSSVFKAEGIGYSYSGIPLSAKNTDDDEIYQFPLNYGDSDVSKFRFVFSIPGQNIFTYVQAGTRTNVVDGWGSITTPYKTYSSVLRVKTILNQVDSLVTSFGSTPIPRRQVIYKWLSTDEKIPVLEITGTEVAGVFTANQIRFRDAYNGIQSPLRPRAAFKVNKTTGVVNADTFSFTNQTTLGQTYVWQITPNTSTHSYVKSTNNKSQNPFVVFSKPGTYTVSLTATNLFGSDDSTSSNLITITDPNSSVNTAETDKLIVYPNPVSDRLHIQNPGAEWVRIYAVNGAFLGSGKIGADGWVSLSHLKAGLYIIESTGGQPARALIHKL